ncbi:filament assembling protein, putative [Plasmodium gallinaceum]|uniref:Filament assembling protein, putative n=1 Tax=Plasmodium gallinaceum TaxID=5849 RepID=A0A1J1GL81_PLAGA|nr:filament assembling protein, putative [Plasmodium gallinaceum]CRG93092.1 filament assembling protein, putative [Plasmodium gallinaceum]
MFDKKDYTSNKKKDTESFKKSDDNLSTYNNKESTSNFEKGENNNSYDSELKKIYNNIDCNKENFKLQVETENNNNENKDFFYDSSINNKGIKTKKIQSLNRNTSEFFQSSDDISSNISTNIRKSNNKINNKFKINKNLEEDRKEIKNYKLNDFSELQNNIYERSLNNSLNLTRNEIIYYCENNKMNKHFSESLSKNNLKLNMNNNIYNDDIFYKTKKMSNDRNKTQKKSTFGCNLKKANNNDYENDNMIFSQGTKKSFDINEKCMNNNTKIKIKRLCEKIEGFEKEIKNEILQKKNVEKEKIYIIREAINKLEKNLNNEIKKRIEHNRNIQNIFTSEILKVQEKIENVVNDKVNEIENAIKVLNDKINTISVNIENEKIKCIQNLEKKNNNIAKEFSNLQSSFHQDKINNKEKENSICKKLEEIEKKSENKIEIEKNIRDSKYQEIISYIEEIKREKKSKNENFQNFVLEEIATVKNGLILESQAREAADDDIVQAVNHYTKALQDSLRLINSN